MGFQESPYSRIIEPIRESLSRISPEVKQDELFFRRCLNESWFMDTLCWLLDSRGSHGLGVSFAEGFLAAIARERSDVSKNYARRSSLLKWGKKGKGIATSGFRSGNASAVREFYIPFPKLQSVGRGKFCDLVLFDFDSSDSLLVVVEGKLFSSNRPDQLQDYRTLTEERFKRWAKTREYVYLSLYGVQPQVPDREKSMVKLNWIALSWTGHIYDLLTELQVGTKNVEARRFSELILWLRRIKEIGVEKDSKKLFNKLLSAAGECFLEELNRLCKKGDWKSRKGCSHILTHSSVPTRSLHFELQPNLSLYIQSRQHGKPLSEKIVVRPGGNVPQLYNLFDIAARDTYYRHFDRPELYLNNRRHLRKADRSLKKKYYRALFQFAVRNRFELQVLFSCLRADWAAPGCSTPDRQGLLPIIHL